MRVTGTMNSLKYWRHRLCVSICRIALAICWFALAAAGGSVSAIAAPEEIRSLTIYNTHTKETVTAIFKRDGDYDRDGLKTLDQVMRDWRRNQVKPIDPKLFDLMWELHQELGSKKPVHLVSGFRSHATNSAMRRRGGGQARNSRHILGKAADVIFPDVPARRIRNSAVVREKGGVGYYPRSNTPFVHLDTGNVRHWPRMPRAELASLFPYGHTKHRPARGGPITKRDARRVLSKQGSRAFLFAKAVNKPLVKQAGSLLAALGLTTPTALARAPQTTASIAPPKTPEKPKRKATSFVVASLTGGLPARTKAQPKPPVAAAPAPKAPARASVVGKTPMPKSASVSPKPLTQTDIAHVALSYRPGPVLPLLNDEPVSASSRLATLIHPDLGRVTRLITGAPPASTAFASAPKSAAWSEIKRRRVALH